METQKTILLAALFFITYLMWQSWHETFPDVNKTEAVIENTQGQIVPNTGDLNKDASIVPNANTVSSSRSSMMNTVNSGETSENNFITVKTDVVEYKINLVGGDISQVKLLQHNKSLKEKEPLELLTNNADDLYVAPNGLTGSNGPDTQSKRAVYRSTSKSYILANDETELKVELIWEPGSETQSQNKNVKITKSFVFTRNHYDVDVKYDIQNNSNEQWTGNVFAVLKRKDVSSKSGTFLSPAAYTGLAVYNTENKFHKLPAGDLSSSGQAWSTKDGWAAMLQHYFLSTWIPNSQEEYKYIARSNNDGTYMVSLISPEIKVQPGQLYGTSMKFYAGPEQTDKLEKLAPGLDRTVDYGIMWPIASVIFSVMKKINSVVSNWGWSIILVTILIKILFYRLSTSSYRSMAKLRVLTPKIEQLKKRCGDDREKMGKAIMELYKKEKVNPLGGCLPMLIQLPFFFALYWVIIESVELRHAPFGLWISDLSVKDPYFVLPIIMGIAMLGQQKLSPAPADPTQEKVMMMMPVIFTFMFMYFPSGLVLYWVVNTVTSIAQQWFITRKIEKEVQEVKDKKKAKKINKLNLSDIEVQQKPLNDTNYS